jgi:hypothetical protein
VNSFALLAFGFRLRIISARTSAAVSASGHEKPGCSAKLAAPAIATTRKSAKCAAAATAGD